MLFIVTIIILNINDKNSYYSQTKYYLLSLDETTNKNYVSLCQEEVDKLIGSSYIYKKGNVYHMIGFVYYNESEANYYLDSAKSVFSKAKVVTISANKIKKSIKNQIKQDINIKCLYEFLCEINNKIYDLLKQENLKYDNKQVYRKLEEIIIKLNDKYRRIEDKNSVLLEKMKISYSVCKSWIEICQEEIYLGDVVDNLKKLFINLCLEQISFRNSLNAV